MVWVIMRTPVFGIDAYISLATGTPCRGMGHALWLTCKSYVLRVYLIRTSASSPQALQNNLPERHLRWAWIFLWFIREIHECQAFWATHDLCSDSAFLLDWAESDALNPQKCFFSLTAVDFFSPLFTSFEAVLLAIPLKDSLRLWVLNSSDVVSCDAWHLNTFC